TGSSTATSGSSTWRAVWASPWSISPADRSRSPPRLESPQLDSTPSMRGKVGETGAPGPPLTRRGGKPRMTARPWALALVLTVSVPVLAAETSQQHVASARAAEKRSDWRKALREWKAAYRLEINAEYLISIGDAYAHLGNKAEARKQYEAYLADPLALPASATKVKAKIAALDAPAPDALALALPAAPGDAKGAQAAAAPPLPLPLPELDGSAAKAAPAKSNDLALALPAVPGAAAAGAAKTPPTSSG